MIFKDHVILKQDSFFYNMTVSIIGFLYSPYLDPRKNWSPVKNQTSRKTDPLLNKKEDEVFRAPVSHCKIAWGGDKAIFDIWSRLDDKRLGSFWKRFFITGSCVLFLVITGLPGPDQMNRLYLITMKPHW